ncbi:MarR family transcriptional regulator [Lentilitoribacter sp. Alg239-R112]|uniref:MarR family winged helix-turn-helix transcriptional regulator n=1 Tax=Lentilitoribacter sp. Alg239-R112 TaxID=2305987 RepID=UPI0013A6E72C|nr:MarR family transcriptional regulator [Lentilitoribacter sp. Alg239-R112]
MNKNEARLSTLIERISRLGRGLEQATDLHPAQWAVLRYLGQANQFSRSPKALTQYMGSTKGTVSQTIIALEKKGLLKKTESSTDARSTNIELTETGEKVLETDPLLTLERKLNAGDKSNEQLTAELESMLYHLISENGGRMFGQCNTCKYFRKNYNSTNVSPHQCGLLDVSLSAIDSEEICVEHELS